MDDPEPLDPKSFLTEVPGIGETLAERIIDELAPQGVPELAEAVDSGKLGDLEGFGAQRTQSLRQHLCEAPETDNGTNTGRTDPLLDRLRCPVCHHESLEFVRNRPGCPHCGAQFDTLRGIPDFVGERQQSVGLAQNLMESSLYARWYDFFRPVLTRLLSPRSLREEYALSTRLLRLKPDSELLDVGCGNGNFTREFARHLRALDPDHNSLVLGLDLSRSMLLEALNVDDDLAVNYLRGDATSLPLRDDTFDRLHCAGSLHLMSDVESTLRNFARVLRPGGVLVLGTFLLGDGIVRPLAKKLGGWLSRLHWFTREELEQLLNAVGFELEETSVAGDAITVRARNVSGDSR